MSLHDLLCRLTLRGKTLTHFSLRVSSLPPGAYRFVAPTSPGFALWCPTVMPDCDARFMMGQAIQDLSSWSDWALRIFVVPTVLSPLAAFKMLPVENQVPASRSRAVVLLSISFRQMCTGAVLLPFVGLLTCLITAYIFQPHDIHETHCRVREKRLAGLYLAQQPRVFFCLALAFTYSTEPHRENFLYF